MSAGLEARFSPASTVPGFETVAPDVDHHALRGSFGLFPSGLAALAAEVDGRRVGLVASSFSVGVSYDPPMALFSVQRSSTTWPVLRRSPGIGVSVLGEHHTAAGAQLASRTGDRFAGLDVTVTGSGALVLESVPLAFDCRIHSETPAGDHLVVVLEITALRTDATVAPIVYHGRAFRSLA